MFLENGHRCRISCALGRDLFTRSVKYCQIVLTEEEEDAVQVARILYDATAADQELTESGTAGEVSEGSHAPRAEGI